MWLNIWRENIKMHSPDDGMTGGLVLGSGVLGGGTSPPIAAVTSVTISSVVMVGFGGL